MSDSVNPSSSSPKSLALSKRVVMSVPLGVAKFAWFHEAHDGDHEFAPNASVPTRSTILMTANRDNYSLGSTWKGARAGNSGSTPSSKDGERTPSLNDDGNQTPGVIRSRPIRTLRVHQRTSHDNRLYTSHLSELLQTFPTTKPYKLPLELPPPISPTRPRSSRSLRRTWLHALRTTFKASRLCSIPTFYLALYFALNLGLTLYNKLLLTRLPFPYTISAVHALCGSLGTSALMRTKKISTPRLNAQERIVLLLFSILYTVNIIISNVSLGIVTVPFHQVVRASTPLFTILLSSHLLGIKCSRPKVIALIPVVAGVGFATYGDYYFTPWGFFLTLLGTILAALKTIFTNLLQAPSLPQLHNSNPRVQSKASRSLTPKPIPSKFPLLAHARLPSLTPLQLLHLLSPLAFLQSTIIAYFSGELHRIWEYSIHGALHTTTNSHRSTQPTSSVVLSNRQVWLMIMNGVMAFGLNVVSFTANKKVGALSMTVAANVKQVLAILCAVVLFNLTITPTNAIGIGLTLIGGALYTVVELGEKKERMYV